MEEEFRDLRDQQDEEPDRKEENKSHSAGYSREEIGLSRVSWLDEQAHQSSGD